MSFNDRDRMNELERLVGQLLREQPRPGLRHTQSFANVAVGEAAGLIAGSGTGTVAGITGVSNKTGHPIWKGSTCTVDPGNDFIIESNAATIIRGKYGGGSATDPDNYSEWARVSRGHFDDTDLDGSNFSIDDPASLLSGVSANDVVMFATGAGSPDTLTVIGGASAGTTISVPWEGFPGTPDPTTGTTTVKIYYAQVNHTEGVTSAESIPFDNGTAEVGTATADGEAANVRGAPFVDGEKFLVVESPGGSKFGHKIGNNRILAQIDGAESGGSYSLDNIVAIEGPEPHADQRLLKPLDGQLPQDDQWFLCELGDDGFWRGIPLSIGSGHVTVWINSTIDALTYDDGNLEATAGVGNGFVMELGPSGALEAVMVEAEPVTIPVWNYGLTEFRASTTEPVIVHCAVEVVDGTEVAILPRVDKTSEVGWDKTKDQSYGHDANEDDPLHGWQDDTDECPEE